MAIACLVLATTSAVFAACGSVDEGGSPPRDGSSARGTPELRTPAKKGKGSSVPGGSSRPGAGGQRPLSQVPVPRPTHGDIDFKNTAQLSAAIRLGKAFFWDVQIGSDNQVACATCHFRGGADNRTFNTVHPGANGAFETVSGAGESFNGTTFNRAVDDVIGSQGVVAMTFDAINPDPQADQCHVADPNANETPDSVFYPQRQVTGRQSPSIVGAIFNLDNFWDGRANRFFNCVDPFGDTGNAGGTCTSLEMGNASLASAASKVSSAASQANGPPENPVEMSCKGRPFDGDPDGQGSLGTKLLARQALQFQLVDPADSVLGALSACPPRGPCNEGLVCDGGPCTYDQLIANAFPKFTRVERQDLFSRVWGQAVQAYVATLIPSQTRFDKFLEGDKSQLSRSQRRGMRIFNGKGRCSSCHAGGELTDASVGFTAIRGPLNEDGGDQGFHNIGVRPTAEDLGRKGTGPNGFSFSVSGANVDCSTQMHPDCGAFKTPSLRNLKLTAPYFHNGGKATLLDVVNFYDAGGDFPNPEKAKRIKPLALRASDKAALVEFLENALLDCRVKQDKPPFDHPSLPVVNGNPDGTTLFLPQTGAPGNGQSCP